jgi:CHAD domain-containing protein
LLFALDRQRDALLTVDRRLRESDRTAVVDGRRIQRRIRSVLKVFGPMFDPEVADAVRGGLRELGESLARCREVDVLRARLHGQLIEEPDEYARQAKLRLDAELDDRASRAWSRIVGFLDGEGYLATLRALDGLLDEPAVTRRAHRAAVTELPPLLDRSWEKLRSLADTALADPDHTPTVHETRKATKTLRYATEATVSALGDNAVVLAAGLEDIQEVLGEHRDSILAAELLVELARGQNTDGVAGFIFGRLHAVEQALAHGAIDDFADAWDRVEDGDLVAALAR